MDINIDPLVEDPMANSIGWPTAAKLYTIGKTRSTRSGTIFHVDELKHCFTVDTAIDNKLGLSGLPYAHQNLEVQL